MLYRSTRSAPESAPEPASDSASESRIPELEAFCSGDELAFEKVHQSFYRPILSWLRDRVSDAPLAEDLTQEVFLKIHRARRGFDPQRRLASWIWAIARNTWNDWARSAGRASQQAIGDFEHGLHERAVCSLPGPEGALQRQSFRRELRQLARRLSGPQRRVLWLSWVKQLSYAEISKRLGLSLDAVKCLAYRARAVLAAAEFSLLELPQPCDS